MKMKAFCVTVVMLLVASTQVFAQLKRFEIFVGAGAMSMRSDIDALNEAYDPKIGLSGGVGASFGISDKLTFNAQLLYERKGEKGDIEFRDQNNSPLGEAEVFLRLNSLSIPVTIGYEFGDKVRMQIAGGVFVGTFLSQKYTLNEQKEDADFKKLDLGATFAFTIYLPVNEKCDIKIGLQDNLGLADLSKSEYSIRTNALNLFVGTSFKF
jgi:hypothetical protein